MTDCVDCSHVLPDQRIGEARLAGMPAKSERDPQEYIRWQVIRITGASEYTHGKTSARYYSLVQIRSG